MQKLTVDLEYVTSKQIVLAFKKHWPESKEFEDIGFKLLCFLYAYDWSFSEKSWLDAKQILKDILISSLSGVSPEQATQCLDGLKEFIDSSYFSPPGKMLKKSWLGEEIKYVSHSQPFQDFISTIDNIKSNINIDSSFGKQILLGAQSLISGFGNLLRYVNNNKLNTLLLFLAVQPSPASGKPWVSKAWNKLKEKKDKVFNEIIPIPVPIPGRYCGPEHFKPLSYSIADKWQFAGGQVSFVDPCKSHDACWEEANSHEIYSRCDNQFYEDLKEKCHGKLTGNARDVCYGIAEAYYKAVHIVTEAKNVFRT